MKILILLIAVMIAGASMAQDSVITNLNLKAGTIKLIIAITPFNEDFVKPHKKWGANLGAAANDNANVNIDTIRTMFLVTCYQRLLELPSGMVKQQDFVDDFTTSILSKRNANALLDAKCDEIEAAYLLRVNSMKASGVNLTYGN